MLKLPNYKEGDFVVCLYDSTTYQHRVSPGQTYLVHKLHTSQYVSKATKKKRKAITVELVDLLRLERLDDAAGNPVQFWAERFKRVEDCAS